jgi:hypothetical protein
LCRDKKWVIFPLIAVPIANAQPEARHIFIFNTRKGSVLDNAPENFAESPFETMSGVTPAGASVLQQTARTLRPLVHLLLEHGVTYPQLADTLKTVFVEAAECSAAGESGRMTDSELAVRTGIHRKDVKRLRGEIAEQASDPSEDAPLSLTSAVFTRWLTDPAFCDKVGQPRALPRNADSAPSFDTLVKSVSKDVHPRTVLNELSRLNLIDIEGDSVQLKVNAFVPDSDFAQMLEYMGANLHDHAAAAVQNMLGTGPRFLEQSIYSDAIYADAVDELAGLARREWTHVLKTVVPEVAQHEPSEQDKDAEADTAPRHHARMRLGMYFYAEGEPPAAAKNQQHHTNRRIT